MKKYFAIFILALLTSVFSCKKNEVSTCVDCGKKVEEINSRVGFVFYDQTNDRYFIDFFSRGFIDVHAANYVCDLPEKFKKTPAQVKVSGTLFETSLRSDDVVYSKTEAYCLKISSIELP